MALIGAWTFVDLSIDTKHITPTVREMPFPIKSKVSSYIYTYIFYCHFRCKEFSVATATI